jgi:ubiquinone/menaquinone biosynthesis C-methylase UbiE
VTPPAEPAYDRFAEIYDVAYHFVDYEQSAARVRDLVRARHPEARTLLELASGTGRYLEIFARDFAVEGLDLNPAMIAKARTRLPSVTVHHADMADFDLSRRYDVVCCLFRSIAYLRTADRLERAVAAMARHLTPEGVLLIEPFFTPETYFVDRVTLNTHRTDTLSLAWMYVSERHGATARLLIHCLVGRPSGVEHFVEAHELGLFRRDDFTRAFARAGLQLEYDAAWPGGTGLYIGRPG